MLRAPNRWASFVAAPFLLLGCATTGPTDPLPYSLKEDIRLAERVDRICFTRTIDRFRENQRRTVIVTRSVDDDYLLVLRNCPQLRNAQSLALTGRTSCLRDDDRIIVSESVFDLRGPGQIGPLSCQIDAIYAWNEEAKASPDTAETLE